MIVDRAGSTRAGRAGLGHGLEDARAAVRDGRRRARSSATCRSTSIRVGGGARAPTSSWSSTRASRCTAWWATSSSDLRHVPGGRAARWSPSSAARSATSTRRRAPTSSRASRELLGDEDRLLLGTDLRQGRARSSRPPTTTRPGVTAEFNRNVLHVINRELDADFDPDAFEHVAFFDEADSWIEMRLRANGEQRVSIAGADLELTLADGEEIRTEISTKFTRERLEARAGAGGDADRGVLHGRRRLLRADAGGARVGRGSRVAGRGAIAPDIFPAVKLDGATLRGRRRLRPRRRHGAGAGRARRQRGHRRPQRRPCYGAGRRARRRRRRVQGGRDR